MVRQTDETLCFHRLPVRLLVSVVYRRILEEVSSRPPTGEPAVPQALPWVIRGFRLYRVQVFTVRVFLERGHSI